MASRLYEWFLNQLRKKNTLTGAVKYFFDLYPDKNVISLRGS